MSNKTKKNKPILDKKRIENSPVRLSRYGDSASDNKTIYYHNLQVLKEYYPDLADRIEKISGNNGLRIVKTGAQSIPNLYSENIKQYYYANHNPREDAAQQIKALQLKNTRLAIFLGIGLGYELLYYLQQEAESQNTNFILIIEKDLEIFKAALEATDLTAVIKKPEICFLVGEEESNVFSKLWAYLHENNRFLLLKAMKPVYHPSTLKLYKEYYLKALQSLRDAASQVLLHFGNDPYDSLLGIEHMLANIDEIVSNPGINLLFDKFKGRPGVVVATGPSLNKNKHLLKGLENKAVIIAADASLKVLREMDFKPHIVVSLERNLPVKRLMEGFSADEVGDVYYAACPVIHPEVFPAYPGPHIIVYRNFDHFKWLGIDKGTLEIKVSAGNMAYKVAEALGCDPIILIGQDLAFSRDGKTHALGTAGTVAGNQDDIHQRGGKFEVMGNDGSPITTNSIWYQCLKAYETDLAEYKGTCINSTEGGAYINGTQVMPFKEAIDKYIDEEFSPLDKIKEHLSLFSDETAQDDVDSLLELINRTILNMTEIVDNCRAGLDIYEKYKAELENYINNPDRINSVRKKINAIEKQYFIPKTNCSKNHETFQLFFAHVFQSYAINFEINMAAIPEKHEDKDLARIEIMLRNAEWYAVIGDLASICVKSLIQAKEKLEIKNSNSLINRGERV